MATTNITAYIIIDQNDPERKPVTSRGGHNIWLNKGPAVCALGYIKINGPRHRYMKPVGKQYEVIELECQEKTA